MEYYRFSKNRAEIIKVLAQKLNGESMLTVWQKNEDESRIFLDKMPFHALFPEAGVFTLHLTLKEAEHIDPQKDVYFLLEEQDFIFKTKLAVEQKELITFQLPREVRLKESRAHERQYFSLDDRRYAEVIFVSKDDDNGISLNCPLVNISAGGACIIVSKETLSSINFNADISLKLTAQFQKAIIRNARVFIKKNLNQDELYAIGVQFQ
jgi:hypothetical protein